MTNLEANKDKIHKIIDKGYPLSCSICSVMNNFDIENGCSGVRCEMTKALNWMLEEYKLPIKLKRWEYDLIRTNDMSHNSAFVSFNTYRSMKKIGHFAGIKDVSMTLEDILNNCEVIYD